MTEHFRPDFVQQVVNDRDLEPATPEEIVRVSHFWFLVDMKTDTRMCWPWLGYQEDGYGRAYWRGKMRGAHELALTFWTGERRSKGWDTCHSCNNPICCNPRHLRFDVRAGNVADMIAAGTQRKGRFTDQQVQVMRTRYANGARQVDIARDFDITNGMVSQIVRGIRYAHAGGPITEKREKYNHG